MFPALEQVSRYEVEHGRPMLSALVVSEGSPAPSPGFADLARHLGLEAADDAARTEIRFWYTQTPSSSWMRQQIGS
ncbi:hypothetical protein [Streptomyces avidinii]